MPHTPMARGQRSGSNWAAAYRALYRREQKKVPCQSLAANGVDSANSAHTRFMNEKLRSIFAN